MRRGLLRYVPAAIAIGVVALAGCGGGDRSGSGGSAAKPAQDERGLAQAAPGEAGKPDGQPQKVEAGPTDRAIVYTGSLAVQAANVPEVAARAATIATRAGGVVAGDSRHSERGSAAGKATLVLRVPSARFHEVMTAVAELGTETRREVKTEDVTEALVDLDTRIASQRASVDRVRALMARANTLAEIVELERQLTAREAELARLEATKRRLDDQVAMSTITVDLLPRDGPAHADEPDERGFLAGLESGWRAFLVLGNGLLEGFGAVLPFLVMLGVPGLAAWWYLRRRRLVRARAD